MLIEVAVALLILILLWVIHYYAHWRKKSSSIFAEKHKVTFLPKVFLLYVSLLIFLCSFILIAELQMHSTFAFTFDSYDHPFTEISGIGINDKIAIHYVLIYSVMLISIWNSFFSFYVYYTTKCATVDLELVSLIKTFAFFSIYAVSFCIPFAIQIHLYYWLCIIIVFLFFCFNAFWSIEFGNMLLNHAGGMSPRGQTKFAKAIILKKRLLLINSIFHGLSIAGLVIAYDISVVRYLPILWSISAFLFAMNFAKNYQLLQHRRMSVSQIASATPGSELSSMDVSKGVVANESSKAPETDEEKNQKLSIAANTESLATDNEILNIFAQFDF